jgi:EpsI family protein
MKPVFNNFTAPATDRRKFMLGLLFASSAGIAAWRQPRTHMDFLGQRKLDEILPHTIGRWNFVATSGLVVPPNDQLAQAIYSQMLTRIYSDGQNAPVMMLLAQSGSQTGFLQIHRPETCYTAGGYQIVTVEPHFIKFGSEIIPANSVEAAAGGQVEHVVYWTRIGKKMPLSWTQQKLAVAEQNLAGIIPDAILVRLSCIDPDADAARSKIDEFARAMLASIPPTSRSVFIA